MHGLSEWLVIGHWSFVIGLKASGAAEAPILLSRAHIRGLVCPGGVSGWVNGMGDV